MADAAPVVAEAKSRKSQSQLPWLTPPPTALTGMTKSGRAVLNGIKRRLFDRAARAFTTAALKTRTVHMKSTTDKKGRVQVKPAIHTLQPEHVNLVLATFAQGMNLSKSFVNELGITLTTTKRVTKDRISASDVKRSVRTVCPFVESAAIDEVLTPAARKVAAKIAHLAADIAGPNRHTVDEEDICEAFFILSGGHVLVPFKARSRRSKKAKPESTGGDSAPTAAILTISQTAQEGGVAHDSDDSSSDGGDQQMDESADE